jgi:hypothetical protein
MELKQSYIAQLTEFPLLSKCFRPYVDWICEHGDDDLEKYDLIRVLNDKDSSTLSLLESRLNKSRNILGITIDSFCRQFGLNHDLLVNDPEKIHDILAEPLFVLDLDANSFTSIQKLPNFILSDGSRTPVSDFTAVLGNVKFAIELKTIRTESWLENGKLLGNSHKPYWWGEMFRSNVKMKIEDKERRSLLQLSNTARSFACQKQMLAIYSRRLGPSTLMTQANYIEELNLIQSLYPQLDFIACKDYGGQVFFNPILREQSLV